MKKILIYIGIASALLQVGCTKDFQGINDNPTQIGADTYDPNYLLTSGQFAFASKGYALFMFSSMWAQIMSSTSNGASDFQSNGDKYVSSPSTPDYVSRIWGVNYGSTDLFSTGAGNLVAEAIKLSKTNPAKVNITATCMIMKVLIMQETTDTYGDVPYSQAFQGKEGVTRPVYDKQQDIYNSMLTELETAIGMFDANQPLLATGDMFYAGDITKWKRFGYSLMLRVAMRLTKVDAATAKTWAEKAAAGGTLTAADDALAKTELSTKHNNNQAQDYVTNIYQTRWSKTLIDYLNAQGDPRLAVVSEIPQDGEASGNPVPGIVGGTQIGMPNGFELSSTNGRDISNTTLNPQYPGPSTGGKVGKYSRPRFSVYGNVETPIFVLTYAETELMLAEAAQRGWTVPNGDAATHYKNGVIAGITELGKLSTQLAITEATATDFANNHPLVAGTELEQINTQYWATTGLEFNYIQSYFNWRRSGFPVLTPVNFPGNFSNGTIPRRQIYPISETTLNAASYNEAVSRLQGGDQWTSRMWWDAQ